MAAHFHADNERQRSRRQYAAELMLLARQQTGGDLGLEKRHKKMVIVGTCREQLVSSKRQHFARKVNDNAATSYRQA